MRVPAAPWRERCVCNGMSTFIRVAEVWRPTSDGTLLEHAGGMYDAAPAFGYLSASMCFGRGEGLPGRAWDAGRPVLLREFEGSYFRRTAAAKAAGLTCAVALPIFSGTALTSVVVLFCGGADAAQGALELWHNDPRVSTDLTLSDGHFGADAEALEQLTRDGSMARGTGAPGKAWQREASVFVDDVKTARGFLRAQVAADAGIARALSLPCSVRVNETWVLSLLSSTRTPIARRIESWLPNEACTHMQRAFGFCESQGRLAADEAPGRPLETLGPIGRALHSGVAEVAPFQGGPGANDPRDSAGLRSTLVVPVLDGNAVSEVVALHF